MCVEDSSRRPGVGFDSCDGVNSQVVEGEELRDTAKYHEYGNDEVHNTTAIMLAIISSVSLSDWLSKRAHKSRGAIRVLRCRRKRTTCLRSP
jgi:hypothetical protein